MIRRITAGFFVLALAAGMGLRPREAHAQQGPAYTLAQVERLLRVNTPRLIDDLRRDCIAFEITDANVTRLRAAGATDAFITDIRAVCTRLPEREAETPPTVNRPANPPGMLNPGSAAMRSLLIPGLGQFYTRRPAVGALFLAAWGGALGFGLLAKETTVECLAPATTSCPTQYIRGESVSRPNLPIGVGAAIAVAVIASLDARSAANRANSALGMSASASAFRITPVLPGPNQAGIGLQLRVRF